MITTRKLLLIIAALWLLAGVNVLLMGITALQQWLVWWVFLGALGVFLLFELLIFSRVTVRYTKRVFALTEKKMPFWKAFDSRGYITIAVMMGSGITLRVLGVIPEWAIALFYTGLGTALCVSGLLYIIIYFMHRKVIFGEGKSHHYSSNGKFVFFKKNHREA